MRALLVPAGTGDERTRLSQPQRWWVIPTLAFWHRRTVWRVVGPWFGLFAATFSTALGLVALPFLAKMALLFAGNTLALGLFERYIRRKLKRRRPCALPPPSEPARSITSSG
ncbi:hypothetical protein [Nannocystis pusilla]|uniref:DUF2062 domain-containing protein n=1 Tax=Nannocystis pusilla TaxID=889268 RepID=A0ABS7TK76_9BACT|nr:hypothetical protein [Nannocystis pusilla]MBZ5708621.1 hypothetical protein [Nannocystis pusilla]